MEETQQIRGRMLSRLADWEYGKRLVNAEFLECLDSPFPITMAAKEIQRELARPTKLVSPY